MALTRAFLKSLQLNEEQVSAVIEAHVETVDGLKAANAEIQSRLDEASPYMDQAKELSEKYEAISKELSDYRGEVSARDARRAKEQAYRDLLRSAGVADKRIDTVVKCDSALIDTLEIGEDGTLQDAATVTKGINDNWSDFITATQVIPSAPVSQPPASQPAAYSAADIRGMSAAEINANWDAIKSSL